MRTDDLLRKYFEGETTHAEEKELRRIFREEDVRAELEVYRPFFAFIEEEAKSRPIAKNRFKRPVIYALGGIAAVILLLIGGIRTAKLFDSSTDYVIIDGRLSGDIHLAREQALAAFSDVSFSREEIFETLFND